MAMKLYWGSGSVWCWRIQMVLEEKALAYESVLLSFSQWDHKKPPISTLNPRGQLPTFVDGEIVICDSGAVCQYLEEAYPSSGPKLIPDDIKLKAQVLQFMYESSNLFEPYFSLFRGYQGALKSGASPSGEEWDAKTEKLRKELVYWESSLTGKKFLMGDTFTMADAFLYPFIGSCFRFGLTAEKYPAIAAYHAHMSERKSTKAGFPPHWNDGPGVPALAHV